MSPSITLRGGHGENGIFPGKTESLPRGTGEQPRVSVHAMRFRSIVVVLSARLYCTRLRMTREREALGEEYMGVSYRPFVAKGGTEIDVCHHICCYHAQSHHIQHVFIYLMKPVISFYSSHISLYKRRRPYKPQRLACNYRGAIAHGTPLLDDDQCALHVLQGPGTGDRS